jgi:hypothetical protein
MSPRILVLPLAAAIAAAATTARADDRDKESYAGSLLAADGIGWLLTIAGAGKDSDAVSYLGLATVAAGGPLVHILHGNPGSAAISLGLRIGLPIGGVALGSALCTPKEGEWFSCLGEGFLLGLAGYVAAVAVDVGVLGYAKKDTDPYSPRRRARRARARSSPSARRTRSSSTSRGNTRRRRSHQESHSPAARRAGR